MSTASATAPAKPPRKPRKTIDNLFATPETFAMSPSAPAARPDGQLRNPMTDPRTGDRVSFRLNDQSNGCTYNARVTHRAGNHCKYSILGKEYTGTVQQWVNMFGSAAPVCSPEEEKALAQQVADAIEDRDNDDCDYECDGNSGGTCAPQLMGEGEHELLTRELGPSRAAWAFFQTWLARHRWMIEADTRGDLELVPVFEREMNRKEEERRERMMAEARARVVNARTS